LTEQLAKGSINVAGPVRWIHQVPDNVSPLLS